MRPQFGLIEAVMTSFFLELDDGNDDEYDEHL